MRRGLISWAKAELPEAVFAMRIAQAQAALATDDLDAFVSYVNITRPAAASWLTGFVPYWSEGVLVVPRESGPFLCVALSKRVQGWIEHTASVEAVISTPHFGASAAARIASGAPNARIGVLELADLPTGTTRALASSGGTLVDATALFERLRDVADPAEIALSAHAAEIARDALGVVHTAPSNAHAVISAIEHAARLAGAEDVFIALAPDLDSDVTFLRTPISVSLGTTFAVRVTLAYKGHWIRLVRTFGRTDDAVAAVRLAEETCAAAAARLPHTSALAAAGDWLIEGTPRAQPLEALAGTRLGPSTLDLSGKVVTVTAVVTVGGRQVVCGGPAVVGSAGRPSALLVRP